MNCPGTLDKTYHLGRKSKKSLIYRLNRRTKEVLRSIRENFPGLPSTIVDLGTADGLMLGMIKKAYPSSQCIGIELSMDLLKTSTDNNISLLQGNVNQLPIAGNTVDIVIATAIIEHLPDPGEILSEAMRVLKPQGLVIVTTPDPFWEKLATLVGHLQEEQHHKVMKLKDLDVLLRTAGFEIAALKKFMLSPIGMPLEDTIEKIVRNIGFHFFFANQLIVGKKPSTEPVI
jgi:ubiquinone/menaquinone biosynthesis C-methylase UbiE